MDHLIRTRVGRFGLQEARKLSQIQDLQERGELKECLIPTDQIFADLPACRVRPETDGLAHNGNPLAEKDLLREEKSKSLPKPGEAKEEGQVRLYDSEGIFVGIFRRGEGLYRPIKMFYDGTDR